MKISNEASVDSVKRRDIYTDCQTKKLKHLTRKIIFMPTLLLL